MSALGAHLAGARVPLWSVTVRVDGVVTQVSPLMVRVGGEQTATPALKDAAYSPVLGDAVMVDVVAGVVRVVTRKVV